MDEPTWETIESDPAVFTELVQRLTQNNQLEVEELISLDAETIVPLQPLGLIFLFKWLPSKDQRPIDEEYQSKNIFFARQVITNACATQAILSVLLNAPDQEVDIGPELKTFRDFTGDFTSDLKGLAIGNSELIRNVHNDFHAPSAFAHEDDTDKEKGDAFHFIAYVPNYTSNGLYELDGLKPGPIRLADDVSKETWVDKAVSAIQERIAGFTDASIQFNLMAVIRSRAYVVEQEIKEKESQLAALQASLSATGEAVAGDRDAVQLLLQGEIDRLDYDLKLEQEKLEQGRKDNCRRRTNYLPFTIELLKCMAEKGMLKGDAQQ